MPGNDPGPDGCLPWAPLTSRAPPKPKPLPRTFKPALPKPPGWPHACRGRFLGGFLACRGEPGSPGWSCLARSLSGPLLVYRGVNPLTIELSDHGAPSLFLFTSNYGAGTPLPFPPSFSASSQPQLPSQPFPAGKTPPEGNSGRLEFLRAGKKGVRRGTEGFGHPKKTPHHLPPSSRGGFGSTSELHPRGVSGISELPVIQLIQLKAVTPGSGRSGPGAALTKGF